MLRYSKWTKRIVIFFLWLMVWEGVALAVANAIVVASPVEVLEYLIRNGREKTLWISIGGSLTKILLGFVFAFVFGIVMALINYKVCLLREVVEPFMAAIKAVPVAAVTVLLLLWFSSNYLSVVLCFIIVLPNVYEQMMVGLRNVDKEHFALANCYGLSWWQRFLTIYRISVVPYLYSSVKICVGLSFKSAVAAEIIATPVKTIGERLYFSKIHLDTPGIFAWTLIIVVLSICMEKVILGLFNKLIVQPSYDGIKSKNKHDIKTQEEQSMVNSVETISLEKIRMSYGGHLVIQDLECVLHAGECHVFMGESGSGKTTLLNVITGIAKLEKGTIRIWKNGRLQSVGKITFGMVFQNEVLLNSYDVIKNIEIFVGHRLTKEEKKDLETILPKQCLREKCATLSGGMKRRVQIARALFSVAPILVMDEPFRGLDEENRQRCIRMIKKYQKERILIVASHDERDVNDLGGIKWELELL